MRKGTRQVTSFRVIIRREAGIYFKTKEKNYNVRELHYLLVSIIILKSAIMVAFYS